MPKKEPTTYRQAMVASRKERTLAEARAARRGMDPIRVKEILDAAEAAALFLIEGRQARGVIEPGGRGSDTKAPTLGVDASAGLVA